MTIFTRSFAFPDALRAQSINLPAREGGWGLLFCVDERDLRYTYAGDAGYLRTMLDIAPDAVPGQIGDLDESKLKGLELPPETLPLRKRGWPETWSSRERRAAWDYLEEGRPVAPRDHRKLAAMTDDGLTTEELTRAPYCRGGCGRRTDGATTRWMIVPVDDGDHYWCAECWSKRDPSEREPNAGPWVKPNF
jgi:hypothetical protein